MKKFLFFLPALMISLNGCNTINQMNELVSDSTQSIQANEYAVERSTQVIEENARLIQHSTAVMSENQQLMEKLSK